MIFLMIHLKNIIGQKVIKRNKIEGRDQIVIPSQKIKSPTSFKEALAEMHKQQKR